MLDDTVQVSCPYCNEAIDVYIDPDTLGTMVQDCDVCCRPWIMHVDRDEQGNPRVLVDRAQ